MKWQIEVVEWLSRTGTPRIFTIQALDRIVAGFRKTITPNTLHRFINNLVDTGCLQRIKKGWYANLLTRPYVSTAEAAQYIRPGAVVSLQFVLGECGFLNNPHRVVTTILPIFEKRHPPKLGWVRTGFGEFRFHGMPARFFSSGTDHQVLDRFCEMATPERALLDWLYLWQSPRSKLTMPPLDTDFDNLDMDRLQRLGHLMDLQEPLGAYIQMHKEYWEWPNNAANMCLELGI